MTRIFFIAFLTMVSHNIVFSDAANAYLGPGAGLGAMGSILAIAVAVIIIVLGVVIYPIRKYVAWKSKKK